MFSAVAFQVCWQASCTSGPVFFQVFIDFGPSVCNAEIAISLADGCMLVWSAAPASSLGSGLYIYIYIHYIHIYTCLYTCLYTCACVHSRT